MQETSARHHSFRPTKTHVGVGPLTRPGRAQLGNSLVGRIGKLQPTTFVMAGVLRLRRFIRERMNRLRSG